jgi:hypothetical protein
MPRTAAALALTVLLALSACAATPAVEPAPTAVAEETPTPSPTLTPTEPAAAKPNPHGLVYKTAGDEARVVTPAGVTVATVIVTSVEVDPVCTSPYAEPPTNGHYVLFNVTVVTTPEFMADGGLPLLFNAHNFKAWDADGTRVNSPVEQAYSCMDTALHLPSEIGPGESAAGIIVWDMPTPSGSFGYEFGPGNGGWEWTY